MSYGQIGYIHVLWIDLTILLPFMLNRGSNTCMPWILPSTMKGHREVFNSFRPSGDMARVGEGATGASHPGRSGDL